MDITWKVLWRKEDGAKAFRKFQNNSPKEAVAFGKSLKKQGLKPNIISSNKAWPPTKEQEQNRRSGDIWCPYCIKWRRFKLFALKKKLYTSEAFLRCPICTISTNDFYVRKYNGMIEHMNESEMIKRLAES